MSDWSKVKHKLDSKEAQLHRIARDYSFQALTSYIGQFKEEYKKPNHLGKMRHRAIRKQCYKRAKREVLKTKGGEE